MALLNTKTLNPGSVSGAPGTGGPNPLDRFENLDFGRYNKTGRADLEGNPNAGLPIALDFSEGNNSRPLQNAIEGKNAALLDPMSQTLSRDNKLPWQKYFEENDELGNLDDTISRAKDSQGYNESLTRGLKSGLIPGASSLGTGNDAMMSALSDKYTRDVGDKLNMLKTQVGFNQPVHESESLGKAAGVAAKAQNLALQNFKEQYQFQQQRKQLYDQWAQKKEAEETAFAGAVLGIGGTVVGGVIGGPAGAAVGGAVGSAAGKSMASNQ